VQSANRRYYLHSAFEVDYDVEHYRAAAASARSSRDYGDYSRAADLYHADFLLGVDSAWAEDIRLELHTTHLELLVAAAESAAEGGQYDAAVHFYGAITQHEPYSESAWEALADLWERRGHRERAAQVRGHFAALMNDV
jgi:two-component SAPR family response regulator